MKTCVFVEKQCCSCGTTFQFEEHLNEFRLVDGREFFCPNGHPQVYSKNKNSAIAELTVKVAELTKEKETLQKELRELKCDLMAVESNKSLLTKIKEKWL